MFHRNKNIGIFIGLLKPLIVSEKINQAFKRKEKNPNTVQPILL
jgi:hypothetical protein